MKIKQSLQLMQREMEKFLIINVVIIALYLFFNILFTHVIKLEQGNLIVGMDGMWFIAMFIAGLASHAENFQLLSQCGISRKTYSYASVIDGVVTCFKVVLFMIITTIFVSSVEDLLQLKSSFQLLGGNLSLIDGNVLGDLPWIVILSFTWLTFNYSFGLALSSINYRLGKLGKAIFWIIFGLVIIHLLTAFGISLEVILEPNEVDIEIMNSYLRPLIDLVTTFLRWLLSSKLMTIIFIFCGFIINSLISIFMSQRTNVREVKK